MVSEWKQGPIEGRPEVIKEVQDHWTFNLLPKFTMAEDETVIAQAQAQALAVWKTPSGRAAEKTAGPVAHASRL